VVALQVLPHHRCCCCLRCRLGLRHTPPSPSAAPPSHPRTWAFLPLWTSAKRRNISSTGVHWRSRTAAATAARGGRGRVQKQHQQQQDL
jgi:hypothetical protein